MPRPRAIRYEHGYRVNFTQRGTRHRLKFRDAHYDDPLKVANDYIDAVQGGRQSDRRVLLKVSLEQYQRWAERTQFKRESTLKSDTGRLSVFLRWAASNSVRDLRNVTVAQLREFQDYFYTNHPFTNRIQKNRQSNPRATWNRYRAALSTFFTWAVDRDMMESNPIRGRKEFLAKEEETEPRYFDDDELAALFDYFDQKGDIYVIAWFRLLPFTGLRRSEALNLTHSRLDLKDQIVRITGESKSYCNRSIPLSDDLMPYFEALPEGKRKDLVFSVDGKTPYFTGSGWYFQLQKAIKACDIDQGGLHAFRHSFGAGLARGGAHPREIQELMGHSTVKMAMRYTHFAPSHLKRSVERLPFAKASA